MVLSFVLRYGNVFGMPIDYPNASLLEKQHSKEHSPLSMQGAGWLAALAVEAQSIVSTAKSAAHIDKVSVNRRQDQRKVLH